MLPQLNSFCQWIKPYIRGYKYVTPLFNCMLCIFLKYTRRNLIHINYYVTLLNVLLLCQGKVWLKCLSNVYPPWSEDNTKGLWITTLIDDPELFTFFCESLDLGYNMSICRYPKQISNFYFSQSESIYFLIELISSLGIDNNIFQLYWIIGIGIYVHNYVI